MCIYRYQCIRSWQKLVCMLFSINQQNEISDTVQRLGSLDKVGQKNVTGQPNTC